jgi:predicted GNAT family N-acyltransferase
LHFEWLEKLSGQDMLEMVALMNQVAVRETTMGYHDPLSPQVGRELMEGIDDELRSGICHLLVARDPAAGDRIVGMVTLAPYKLPARKHIVEMKRCVIAEEHRGTFLLDGFGVALEKCLALGCDRVVLDVRSDGPEQLWRRLGFQEYGRMEDYARVRGRTVAGIYLQGQVRDLLALLDMAENQKQVPVRQIT